MLGYAQVFLSVQVGKSLAIGLQRVQIWQQVVAINVGDFQIHAQLRQNLFNFCRHAFGVQPARVADDFYILLGAQGSHVFDLLEKGADIAHVLTAGLLLAVQNRHG